MLAQPETHPGRLTSQALALWPQWRAAEPAERTRIKQQVTSAEAIALDRLQQNLRTTGDPSQWFSYASATAAAETLTPGVVATLLRGLHLQPADVEEFARVLRIGGSARRALFLAAVREHLPASAPTLPTPSENDPFNPAHPCQSAPLEIPAMSHNNGTAMLNGRSAAALITPPKPSGVREMVEVTCDQMGLDLSREIPPTVRAEICQRSGLTEGQVKGAVEKIRKLRGINTKTGATGTRAPRGRKPGTTAPKTAPTTAAPVTPDPEPTPVGALSLGLARKLAVELAGELLQASRETDGDRGAMLLLAGSLLGKVL